MEVYNTSLLVLNRLKTKKLRHRIVLRVDKIAKIVGLEKILFT